MALSLTSWADVRGVIWEVERQGGGGEKEAFVDERNRVRLSPSPAQVERMDEVLM